MVHWIRPGLSSLLALPDKIPLDSAGNPTTSFLTIRVTTQLFFFESMKSSVSLYDPLVQCSLAFTISQLTHPIFSPSSLPSSSSALSKVPKTREAQFTMCAPSLPPQSSSLPPLLHQSQKLQRAVPYRR